MQHFKTRVSTILQLFLCTSDCHVVRDKPIYYSGFVIDIIRILVPLIARNVLLCFISLTFFTNEGTPNTFKKTNKLKLVISRYR